MKINKRLLPWFICVLLSEIIFFIAYLVFDDMTEKWRAFYWTLPFYFAFMGKCVEIRGHHPRAMPLLIGIPAGLALIFLIFALIKDTVDPFGWWSGHLYIAPFVAWTFLPAIVLSAVLEIVIAVRRKKYQYIYDENDRDGVWLPLVLAFSLALMIPYLGSFISYIRIYNFNNIS